MAIAKAGKPKPPAMAAASAMAASQAAPSKSPAALAKGPQGQGKRWASLAAVPQGQVVDRAAAGSIQGTAASARGRRKASPTRSHASSQASQASKASARSSGSKRSTEEIAKSKQLMEKFRKAAGAMGMNLEDVMSDAGWKRKNIFLHTYFTNVETWDETKLY